MNEILKKVNLLYIIHGDSILLRKFIHQDYEVLDVFAFNDDEGIDLGIQKKLTELFGKAFPYRYYGTIESTIKKEGVIVHIDIKTYKVSLDKRYKVLGSYADDVTIGSSVIWLDKSKIANEKRLREGDRKILERVFEDKNIKIKIVEDQGKSWIGAKTIAFEEK